MSTGAAHARPSARSRWLAAAVCLYVALTVGGWYFCELTTIRCEFRDLDLCAIRLRQVAAAHAAWLRGNGPPVQWLMDNGQLAKLCPCSGSEYLYLEGRRWHGYGVVVMCTGHGAWRRDLLLRWHRYPVFVLIDTAGRLRTLSFGPVAVRGPMGVSAARGAHGNVPSDQDSASRRETLESAGFARNVRLDSPHSSMQPRDRLLSRSKANHGRLPVFLRVVNAHTPDAVAELRSGTQLAVQGWALKWLWGTQVRLASREGYLYAVTGDGQGWRALKLELASGRSVWRANLRDDDTRAVALTVGDGWLAVVAREVHILDDRTGRPLIRLPLPHTPGLTAAAETAGEQHDGPAIRGSASGHILCVTSRSRAGSIISVIDAKRGQLLWSGRFEGFQDCDTVVSDQHVYAVLRDGSVCAFDGLSGRIVWKTAIGAIPTGQPVLFRSMLVIPTRGGMAVVDCGTGEHTRWDTAESVMRVVPVSARSLVTIGRNRVARFELADDARITRRWDLETYQPIREAAATRRHLYVRSDDRLIAVDVSTGRVLWELPVPRNAVSRLLASQQDVVVRWGDYLLALRDQFSPHVWHRITSGPISGLAVTDSRVFIMHAADRDVRTQRLLTALDSNTGRRLWGCVVGTGNERTERLAAAENIVVASFGRRVLAWSASSGAVVWTLPVESPCYALATDGVYVYVAARFRGNTGVHAFDARTARLVWSVACETRLPLALSQDRLALTTVGRELLVLEKATGRVVARRQGATSAPVATEDGFVAWAGSSDLVWYPLRTVTAIGLPPVPPSGSVLFAAWKSPQPAKPFIIRPTIGTGLVLVTGSEPLEPKGILPCGPGRLLLRGKRMYAWYSDGVALVGVSGAAFQLVPRPGNPDGTVPVSAH